MRRWLQKRLRSIRSKVLPVQYLYWISNFQYRSMKSVPERMPDWSRMNVLNFYRNNRNMGDKIARKIGEERFNYTPYQYCGLLASEKLMLCEEGIKRAFEKRARFLSLRLWIYNKCEDFDTQLNDSLSRSVLASPKAIAEFSEMICPAKGDAKCAHMNKTKVDPETFEQFCRDCGEPATPGFRHPMTEKSTSY